MQHERSLVAMHELRDLAAYRQTANMLSAQASTATLSSLFTAEASDTRYANLGPHLSVQCGSLR